ncbi:hypothetical protein CB599_11635 [Salmonella enterica subsp. enterica serovar Adjame]|nr:hypothetical protein [Salmonella enterica subsp. enterica serovar Adjame]
MKLHDNALLNVILNAQIFDNIQKFDLLAEKIEQRLDDEQKEEYKPRFPDLVQWALEDAKNLEHRNMQEHAKQVEILERIEKIKDAFSIPADEKVHLIEREYKEQIEQLKATISALQQDKTHLQRKIDRFTDALIDKPIQTSVAVLNRLEMIEDALKREFGFVNAAERCSVPEWDRV